MAIDTAAKRRSAATTFVVWGPPSVTPDASPDAAWRSSAGWGYEGIATAEPADPPDGVTLAAERWSFADPVAEDWQFSDPASERWSFADPVEEEWSAP